MGPGKRDAAVTHLEFLFPGLRNTPHAVTSPSDPRYNCIAWAAGATDRWWWPGHPSTTYWPENVPRVETLDAFKEVFAHFGYSPCDDQTVEPGMEKVALFAGSDGVPTHAARQLRSGLWTSKLGKLHDIEHVLTAVEGDAYGVVAQIMKRPFALGEAV